MRNIFTSFLLVGLMIVILICPVHSVEVRNEAGEIVDNQSYQNIIPGELLVMFKSGTLGGFSAVRGAPAINYSEAKAKGIRIPQNISNRFNALGVSKIKKVFETFDAKDTVGVTLNGEPYKVGDFSQVFKLTVPEETDVLTAIKDLESLGDVVYAEPNGIMELFYEPDDTRFSDQWGLYNSNYPGVDIGAKAAWDMSRGNLAIKIGIVDVGIDYTHPDLGGSFPNSYKVAGGWDWYNNDSDPRDVDGHGTHCAGIAAAYTNNNTTGIAGVAGGLNRWDTDKGCQLFAFKVGAGTGINTAYAASAIEEGTRPSAYGCHVINASFGGPDWYETLRSAINAAHRYGASFISAKGNYPQGGVTSATQLVYPSDYDRDWVISIGNLTEYGALSGTSCYSNGLDLVAPGHNILSTFPNNTYAYLNGTSMAAPHVAGIAGLLRSDAYARGLYLHVDDIEGIIKSAASPQAIIGETYDPNKHGSGLAKADKALQLLRDPYVICRNNNGGGYSVGNTGTYSMVFYNTGGVLATGTYLVKRYDVRSNVTYPQKFASAPYVWSRGVAASTGWSAASPNYEVGYCSVVSGTETSSGCQLKSFVYEVWDNQGNRLGWYPCQPSQVTFAYTVLGHYFAPSSAKISGWYEPYSGTKVPEGFTHLSWSCISGTLPIKYTVQVKEPYTTGSWTNLLTNTTATSYSYRHQPSAGGSGYRVIVNDGKTTLTSNAFIIYLPNPGDPIVSYSTTPEATAHSNGKKLVIDNAGKLHVVFTSNDTVFYTTSTDDGETWSTQAAIGQGKNPAIELTSSQTPSVCWSKGNELYNSQHNADVWGAPRLIYTGPAGSVVSYLSYVLDQKTNNSYLGWVDDETKGSAVYISPYTAGDSSSLAPTPIDQGAADAFKSPSLALDRTGKLKVTWSRDGRVYYYDEAGQLELGENGIHPIVETYGDRTSVVWQEEIAPGVYQIVKRNKGPLGWAEKQVISYPDEKNADFPVVAANGQYVYSKNTAANDYDIVWHGEYDNGWTQYERNISYASGGISKYPSVAFRQLWPKSKLYILWTEDLPDAKVIPSTPVKIYAQSIEPVPYYYADLGTEEATVYTIQKAGTLSYGQTPDLTVDYHPTQLKYSFSGLDPARAYMLKAVYYHESNDRIQQKMKVDGQQFDVANLKPKEKVEFKRWLMPKLYSDGQIEISIDKQKGEYAVCAVISIVEYEKDCVDVKDGGAQATLSESKTVAHRYELLPNAPNPASAQTTFRYQLAQPGKTTFKVYNTLGQAVKTIVDAYQQPGVYSVNWDGRDTQGKKVANGVYFYRINSGEFDATKKMVILK